MWTPQQVKFRMRKTDGIYKFSSFFARDHSPYPARISVSRDTMDLKEIGKFYKNDLPNNTSYSLLNPKFEKLDDKTCLLTIPSFYLEYKNETDSLMLKNASILASTDHFIIDLRNNRGGAVGAFKKILPYLYTNPILTENGKILATDDNIKDGYEKPLPDLPEDLQEYFKKIIIKLKAHRGELYLAYPADTIKYDTVFKNPARVSVIMNDGSASASELFILQAKQSTKVKLFGTNSAGSVNYVESVTTQMPCKFFNLIYPATRLMRTNGDGTDPGIKPDVAIPVNVTDWIDFVKKYKTK
jgi:C-terminal processing protease CtpA/Prc